MKYIRQYIISYEIMSDLLPNIPFFLTRGGLRGARVLCDLTESTDCQTGLVVAAGDPFSNFASRIQVSRAGVVRLPG